MSNIPCILIPAIVGLISGILGYLLGKMLGGGTDNSSNATLLADLDACRSNSRSLSSKITSLEADLAASKTTQSFAAVSKSSIVFDALLAATVFGKKVKENDLKIVEGIGPKIEALYHKAGIKTWLALSETAVEKSQAILDAEGEQYVIHNPSTWAKQAGLAHQGKWQELKDWQDALDGGK